MTTGKLVKAWTAKSGGKCIHLYTRFQNETETATYAFMCGSQEVMDILATTLLGKTWAEAIKIRTLIHETAAGLQNRG